MSELVVASYGGGVNSTAMLLGLLDMAQQNADPGGTNHLLVPDVILFADTGGEKPETYAYVERFSKYLNKHGFQEITTVRVESPEFGVYTLEQDCLRRGELPAIAYGFKTCSIRFKAEPQEKYLNNQTAFKELWRACASCGQPRIAHRKGKLGHAPEYRKATKLIGFDAGEPHRQIESKDPKYRNRYPLIEWGWDREACVETIERHGQCVPPKSSCFFCPNMDEEEIFELREQHPELIERALAIEEAAKPTLVQIKGLARQYSWQQILDYDRDQIAMLPKRVRSMPCACYDGE